MKNFKTRLFTATATLALAGVVSVAQPSEASAATQYTPSTWSARTVAEIKADMENNGSAGSKYRLRWGDTLSAVARATDMSVEKLVKVNDINNANVIFSGNTIHLSADKKVMTIEKDDEVVSYDVSEEEVVEVETPEEVKEEMTESETVTESVVEEVPAEETEVAAEETTEAPATSGWSARTVADIRADVNENASGAATYTFQWGDTLSTVARAANVSIGTLMEMNNISNSNLVVVGSTIRLSDEKAVVEVATEDEVITYDASEEVEEEVVEEAVEEAVEEVQETPAVESTPVESEPAAETQTETATATPAGRTLTVEATAYSTNQPSLGYITYSGIDLRENPRVVAVDPSVIPLGSTIYVPGYGEYVAGDTGSAIIGNRIDVHITNLNDAIQFGRKTMEITIVE